jgi:ADP-ribosylglycohydrolase
LFVLEEDESINRPNSSIGTITVDAMSKPTLEPEQPDMLDPSTAILPLKASERLPTETGVQDKESAAVSAPLEREFRPPDEVLSTLRPWQDICAGVVLAAAIGDAMGHPTEFIGSVESIRKRYGPEGVTKFELYWERGGRRFAPYTDDTQMAEAVLRSLLESRAAGADLEATMKSMADRFVEWSHHPQGGHRAPGNACLSGCRALEAGKHWSKAGGPTAGGCGSVMRAYPFGLIFANDLQKAEHWAVEHSRLTHNDPIALAACAAMAVGVARLARGEHPRTASAEMVGAACRYSPQTAAMMATAIDEARRGIGPEVTLDRLRAWAAHEAIAAAAYLIERHPDDAKAAILEGANTPGDSDSIATLGGALLGARCGARALPVDWVRDVERADELLALALRI